MDNKIFIIDTSDSRMFYLLRYIRDAGFTAESQEAGLQDGKIIYCYSPSKRFTNEELYRLQDGSTVIAGRLPQDQLYLLGQKRVIYKNILSDEIFAIENAMQTAEAALMLMIRGTNLSIYDMHIALLGYGRVGKAIAQLYSAMGLDYTIFTGDYYERAAAYLCKREVYDLGGDMSEMDVIINTIPARVLTLDKLQRAKKSCYILDLSTFAGCDNSDISALGLIYDNALGLPGKYSPKSAGRILGEAILRTDEVRLC